MNAQQSSYKRIPQPDSFLCIQPIETETTDDNQLTCSHMSIITPVHDWLVPTHNTQWYIYLNSRPVLSVQYFPLLTSPVATNDVDVLRIFHAFGCCAIYYPGRDARGFPAQNLTGRPAGGFAKRLIAYRVSLLLEPSSVILTSGSMPLIYVIAAMLESMKNPSWVP